MTDEPVEQAAELLAERAMRHHFGGKKNLRQMESGTLARGVRSWRKLYLARARKDARALARPGCSASRTTCWRTTTRCRGWWRAA